MSAITRGDVERALKNCRALDTIKEALAFVYLLDTEWLIEHLSSFSVKQSVEFIKAALNANKKNLDICVQIASKSYEKLEIKTLVEMFESLPCLEGLFIFLQSVMDTGHKENLHLEFIKTAHKLKKIDAMTKYYKESNAYDPNIIALLLMEANLSDPLALITVCERFNYISNLISHLFQNDPRALWTYLHEYPTRLPIVMEHALKSNFKEIIWQLFGYLGMFPFGFSADELISVVEQEKKLDLLQPWLEACVQENCKEKIIHETLAKICIKPAKFLFNNEIYDRKVVANYCKDPQLACFVLEHGPNHKDFIEFCIEKQDFKKAAQRLISQGDKQLWAAVLSDDDVERRQSMINQVKNELQVAEDLKNIYAIIEAFEKADLPYELIKVLEVASQNLKVLHDLDCLRDITKRLLLKVISADRSRAMELIEKTYHPREAVTIANAAIHSNLLEEAFAVFRKYGHNEHAMKVLIEMIQDLDRAFLFAKECNKTSVWGLLAAKPMGRLQCQEINLSCHMVVLARQRILHANSRYDDCIFMLRDRGRYNDYMECQDLGRKLFEEMKPAFHRELEKTLEKETLEKERQKYNIDFLNVDLLLIFNNIGNQILLKADHHQLTLPHAFIGSMADYPPGLGEVLFSKYHRESFIKLMNQEYHLPSLDNRKPTMYTCFYLFGVSWQPCDGDGFVWCNVSQIAAPISPTVSLILKAIGKETYIPLDLEKPSTGIIY